MSRSAFLTLAVIPLCACAWWGASDLADRLAASDRSDAEKERDAGRRPAEVIDFLGIEPGMQVLDIIAAGGYYTEVLSIAVGEEGRVYAQNNSYVLRMRDGANDTAMTARLAGGRLPNVERLDVALQDLTLPDGSLDAAITSLNFHDVYNGRGEQAAHDFLAVVHRKLAPGGVLGIIDHVGVAGNDNTKLHRIETQRVIDVVAQSGFTLDGESDLLSNPEDDHTQGVFAPGLRGHTDRFLLRLRKKK